jgi:hypothetical protein
MCSPEIISDVASYAVISTVLTMVAQTIQPWEQKMRQVKMWLSTRSIIIILFVRTKSGECFQCIEHINFCKTLHSLVSVTIFTSHENIIHKFECKTKRVT